MADEPEDEPRRRADDAWALRYIAGVQAACQHKHVRRWPITVDGKTGEMSQCQDCGMYNPAEELRVRTLYKVYLVHDGQRRYHEDAVALQEAIVWAAHLCNESKRTVRQRVIERGWSGGRIEVSGRYNDDRVWIEEAILPSSLTGLLDLTNKTPPK